MTDSLVSMLIVAGELLFVLALILGVIIYRIRARRRRDREIAQEFVAKVKTHDNERLDRLKKVLLETYGLDEEVLNERAGALIKLEKSLYQRFLQVFLGKDREALTSIDETVDNLLRGYRELVPSQTAQVSSDTGGSPEELEELKRSQEALQTERDQLEQKLAEANEQMEMMLREYVSMYGGSRDEAKRKLGTASAEDEHKEAEG